MTRLERGDVAALLKKSRRSAQAAHALLAHGDPDFAVSRAYYAMFYAAEAMLLARGEQFSSHAAVVSAFGRLFARGGEVVPELHRWLIDAGQDRMLGDYLASVDLSDDAVKQHIQRAEEFIAVAEAWIARQDK